MELIDFVKIFFAFLTIFLFVKANTKKYSHFRKKEAKRYFEGSTVKDRDHTSRSFVIGLALVKDKVTGKYNFKRQAKVAGTGLLYD